MEWWSDKINDLTNFFWNDTAPPSSHASTPTSPRGEPQSPTGRLLSIFKKPDNAVDSVRSAHPPSPVAATSGLINNESPPKRRWTQRHKPVSLQDIERLYESMNKSNSLLPGAEKQNGGDSQDEAHRKLYYFFLFSCEDGDVESVNTIVSLFAGRDLDINAKKSITHDPGSSYSVSSTNLGANYKLYNYGRERKDETCRVSEVTGLFLASISENEDGGEEIVKILMQNGAQVDIALEPDGCTPLFVAVMRGKARMVRLLLDIGADPCRKVKGETAAHVACRMGASRTIIKLLFQYSPILASTLHDDGRSPLFMACMFGHRDAVEECLEAGVDVNATVDGLTPLLIASYKGHVGVVEALLTDRRVRINKPALDGTTPLFIAAHKGHSSLIQLLLAKDADVNIAHNDGRTPLFVAAQFGHTEVAELLIAYGSDVNHCLSDGYTTPLYVATLEGHTDVMDLLIASGAIAQIDEDTIDMEPVQTRQSHKGQSPPKSINPAQHKGKSPASIYISSPRDFKKVEEHPSTTAQEVSKVVIQIEEARKRRIKAFIRADMTFKNLLDRATKAVSAEEAEKMRGLYTKYKDIYSPILDPSVVHLPYMDSAEIEEDADFAEEEGVKKAYTQAQSSREEMRPLHEIRALLTHETRPVLGTVKFAPVTFRSKSREELIRLFGDIQRVEYFRRIVEAVYPDDDIQSNDQPERTCTIVEEGDKAIFKTALEQELSRIDTRMQDIRKQQQDTVDIGAFYEEIVKRATNYSKMEWLVNTHRKIAIESRQQLLHAVQEELHEEMGMKQKGTQIVRQSTVVAPERGALPGQHMELVNPFATQVPEGNANKEDVTWNRHSERRSIMTRMMIRRSRQIEASQLAWVQHLPTVPPTQPKSQIRAVIGADKQQPKEYSIQ